MSYSIVRVSKVKSGTNTTGIQKHVQRENNNYDNEDIDHSKTHLNYDLVHQLLEQHHNAYVVFSRPYEPLHIINYLYRILVPENL